MFPIRDTIPSKNTPFGTWILIAANVVVFIFELMLPEPMLQAFFYYFGIVPARYSHPEWAAWVGLPLDDYWPFVTSMFLHGGWLHIIGNMWTLWIFGDNVEDRMGTPRWFIFSRIPIRSSQRWAPPARSRESWALIFCFFPMPA
jgi:membrane associated rhomboid family serine protease